MRAESQRQTYQASCTLSRLASSLKLIAVIDFLIHQKTRPRYRLYGAVELQVVVLPYSKFRASGETDDKI